VCPRERRSSDSLWGARAFSVHVLAYVRSACSQRVVGDSQRRRWRGCGAAPPRHEMPNLEDPLEDTYVSVSDSDDGFDDFPDVYGWGFGFGT
jgi:hypothetical protein